MRKLLLSLLTGVFCFTVSCGQTIDLGTTTVEATTLYTSPGVPWELKYGPGDSLWMTTREGDVFRIHPITGMATQLLEHTSNVWQSGESGMLGMTFHPDFINTPHVFIVYTYTSGGDEYERLSRFTYSTNSLINEVVLIDDERIDAATIHDGSRLLILPDNTLLMTTGDAANTGNAQNTGSYNGKILRTNLDGSIPADNPDPLSHIYTTGHRNPQGLALHPNGTIFETEHGPGNNDEFQIIEAGRNYGWPNVEGYCDNDIGAGSTETNYCTANNVMEPLASWNPVPGGTWAPNDLIWYTHPSIPEFQNTFLVTFLKTAKVRRVTLNAAGTAITDQDDFFNDLFGRLRDITTAPNGDIFLATNSAPYRIIRIRNPLAPVPVSLTDYNVFCNQNKLVIKWKTQAESNSKQFILYRSNNGRDFEVVSKINTLAQGGNSNIPLSYSYTDNTISSVKSYYKLVSEDLNGRKEEFGVISASCNGGIQFTLSPNPAVGRTELRWSNIANLKIKVFNSMGQLVYLANSENPAVLPVNKWPADLYLITAYDTKNIELYRGKLIVR